MPLSRNALLVVGALLGIVCPPLQAQTLPDRIRVAIDGLHSDQGQVECTLSTSATWLSKHADAGVAHAKSDISHGQAVCEFPGIAPGTYAVSVFHDESSNGRLDRNFLRIPREGIGASNNASGSSGTAEIRRRRFSFCGRTTRSDDQGSISLKGVLGEFIPD